MFRGAVTPVTGIAHRNAGPGDVVCAFARAAIAGRGTDAGVVGAVGIAAADRPPSAHTVIPAASNPTTTVPSRSVLSTLAPDAASRSRVAWAGWPYGFPVPAEATATVGRVASTNAWVVAVLLP